MKKQIKKGLKWSLFLLSSAVFASPLAIPHNSSQLYPTVTKGSIGVGSANGKLQDIVLVYNNNPGAYHTTSPINLRAYLSYFYNYGDYNPKLVVYIAGGQGGSVHIAGSPSEAIGGLGGITILKVPLSTFTNQFGNNVSFYYVVGGHPPGVTGGNGWGAGGGGGASMVAVDNWPHNGGTTLAIAGGGGGSSNISYAYPPGIPGGGGGGGNDPGQTVQPPSGVPFNVGGNLYSIDYGGNQGNGGGLGGPYFNVWGGPASGIIDICGGGGGGYAGPGGGGGGTGGSGGGGSGSGGLSGGGGDGFYPGGNGWGGDANYGDYNGGISGQSPGGYGGGGGASDGLEGGGGGGFGGGAGSHNGAGGGGGGYCLDANHSPANNPSLGAELGSTCQASDWTNGGGNYGNGYVYIYIKP